MANKEKTENLEEQTEKKTRAKKASKKVEEKPKALRDIAWAYSGPISVTPRKARLVVDLVRGKTIDQAYDILANTNKAAVRPVVKLIHSAEANAVNNFHMDRSLLYIDTIFVNESFRLKRFSPRAKGSSSPIIKRWSKIKVAVKEKGAAK